MAFAITVSQIKSVVVAIAFTDQAVSASTVRKIQIVQSVKGVAKMHA